MLFIHNFSNQAFLSNDNIISYITLIFPIKYVAVATRMKRSGSVTFNPASVV